MVVRACLQRRRLVHKVYGIDYAACSIRRRTQDATSYLCNSKYLDDPLRLLRRVHLLGHARLLQRGTARNGRVRMCLSISRTSLIVSHAPAATGDRRASHC